MCDVIQRVEVRLLRAVDGNSRRDVAFLSSFRDLCVWTLGATSELHLLQRV